MLKDTRDLSGLTAAETAGIVSEKIRKELIIDIVRPSLLDMETCEQFVFHVRVNYLVYRSTNLVPQVFVIMSDLGLTRDETWNLMSGVCTPLEFVKLNHVISQLDNNTIPKAGA